MQAVRGRSHSVGQRVGSECNGGYAHDKGSSLEPRKESHLIVACTVITDVPEAIGP
jgi:hypothetical protein